MTAYWIKQRANDTFRMGMLCKLAGQHKNAKALFEKGKRLKRRARRMAR